MKALRVTMLALAIGGLAACQTMDEAWDGITNLNFGKAQTNEQRDVAALPTVVCPQVKIVDELSALSEFSDISSPADYNLVSRVTLAQSESACTYDGNNAVVDLKLVFEGQIGPKGRVKPSDTPTFSYPFFIAVTNANGEIKAKEVFGASVTYAAGQNGHTYYESLRQIIPVENGIEARNFNVLVGFQLSPEQLRYNRANIVPIREEARRQEESLKETVQIGSNNAGTALGLTSAAQQATPGIKITPGYPAQAAAPAALVPAAAATAAASAPVKAASSKAAPRPMKNPPIELVSARKPQKSIAAPAPETAPAPAPAAVEVTEPTPAPAAAPAPETQSLTEPAPASEAVPAPAPNPAGPVAIPGGDAVIMPTAPDVPAAAPLVAPAPAPAPEPAPAIVPPAEPAAPAAPAEPSKEEEKQGSLDQKAVDAGKVAPAAGEEAPAPATAVKREPISTIDLTAPME